MTPQQIQRARELLAELLDSSHTVVTEMRYFKDEGTEQNLLDLAEADKFEEALAGLAALFGAAK